jgi:hypothetical protein
MSVPTVACTNCGKPFTTDDLRGTQCRYCGTLLAHHARAAQQLAVVSQVLADRNGNGIPDAFEGLAANAQANALNQAFGAPPPAGGFGYPMSPPAQMHAVNMQVQQAATSMTRALVTVFVVIAILTVLGIAAAITLFVFMRQVTPGSG